MKDGAIIFQFPARNISDNIDYVLNAPLHRKHWRTTAAIGAFDTGLSRYVYLYMSVRVCVCADVCTYIPALAYPRLVYSPDDSSLDLCSPDTCTIHDPLPARPLCEDTTSGGERARERTTRSSSHQHACLSHTFVVEFSIRARGFLSMQNMLEVSRILQYNFHFLSVQLECVSRCRQECGPEQERSIALSRKRSALTRSNISGSHRHIRAPSYSAHVFMYYAWYLKTFACSCTCT
ncbi:hypothetical protein X777_07394 [Ooceraea biroi]|uniref:Uncharacterized protein n=1 Tax=Ooceraea biroi TaxID=2015173 RepID=A0A026WD01_OOCBI|nr:hypothetical protein X777_07394 [Ooceraea biroi]